MRLDKYIRAIKDFPQKGILFRDITTLLNDAAAFSYSINKMAKIFKGEKVEMVAGIESRGFIFGSALAYKLKCGFVPLRKPEKLPAPVFKESFRLEYGTDSLQMHRDAFKQGARLIIVDDLLATGGTAKAALRLVKKLQADVIGLAFVVELKELKGREKIREVPVYSLVEF
ncbi:MAG: adenine phosphoribosyltransferase [Candidatus Omnitrophica bacterium]|nr:adenine phosphoribosyltransferase [Candidatus Omnitrophota bacterium]